MMSRNYASLITVHCDLMGSKVWFLFLSYAVILDLAFLTCLFVIPHHQKFWHWYTGVWLYILINTKEIGTLQTRVPLFPVKHKSKKERISTCHFCPQTNPTTIK